MLAREERLRIRADLGPGVVARTLRAHRFAAEAGGGHFEARLVRGLVDETGVDTVDAKLP
jgi:hypothetical protein